MAFIKNYNEFDGFGSTFVDVGRKLSDEEVRARKRALIPAGSLELTRILTRTTPGELAQAQAQEGSREGVQAQEEAQAQVKEFKLKNSINALNAEITLLNKDRDRAKTMIHFANDEIALMQSREKVSVLDKIIKDKSNLLANLTSEEAQLKAKSMEILANKITKAHTQLNTMAEKLGLSKEEGDSVNKSISEADKIGFQQGLDKRKDYIIQFGKRLSEANIKQEYNKRRNTALNTIDNEILTKSKSLVTAGFTQTEIENFEAEIMEAENKKVESLTPDQIKIFASDYLESKILKEKSKFKPLESKIEKIENEKDALQIKLKNMQEEVVRLNTIKKDAIPEIKKEIVKQQIDLSKSLIKAEAGEKFLESVVPTTLTLDKNSLFIGLGVLSLILLLRR